MKTLMIAFVAWGEGSELVDRVVLMEVRQAKLGMDY